MVADGNDATPISFAVRHVNASVAVPITEAELLGAVRTDAPRWRHHIHAFLDETDVETLSDIVRSGALTYADLARAAQRLLPAGHETRDWLDERG